MFQVAVSIGSNVERERNVCLALSALRDVFGVLTVSPVYESPAYGFAGPDFYNLAVVFETLLDVRAVQIALQDIESCQGRMRQQDRFSSRALDLDLLLYADAVLYDKGLDVPRREMLERAYILKPLADLLPDFVHPVTGNNFASLWVDLARGHAVISQVNSFEPDEISK